MHGDPASASFLKRLFLTPGERRLRAGWRLAGQFVLMVALLGIVGVPLGMLTTLFPEASGFTRLMLATAISFVAIVLSIFIARRRLDRRSFISLGLVWGAQATRDLFFGFLAAGLMMALVYLAEWAAGWLTFKRFAWEASGLANVGFALLVSAIAFVLVGFQEELLFRGYWMQNLSEGLNLAWGVSLSAGAFALAHSANPNMSWNALAGLFLGGLLLAFGFLRTGQLWLPIGLHIGWNFFEGTVFGFAVSGSIFYRLIEQSVLGPELVTGGEFGPEAGLIILPAMLLGVVLIYYYTRSRRRLPSNLPRN